jgi:hypothetical protein
MRPAASIRLATALLALGACGDPAAVRCDDDTYCPADTRCGSAGVCLVTEGACPAFGENAPCARGDGEGFCAGAACQPGVSVAGRLVEQGGGPLGAVTVEAVDSPWMRSAITDETGEFTVSAVAGDRLVLRLEAQGGFPPLRTRDLALGAQPYALNGDRDLALRVVRAQKLMALVTSLGREPDPSRGFVMLGIVRPGGVGLGGATASLVGPGETRAIYFDPAGGADLTRIATSAETPIVVFVDVEPGRYTLPVDHPQAVRCVGSGADAPAPIELEVVAGELTSAGWATCTALE